QQLEDLDERNEIIMELRRVAPSTATSGDLRTFLAKFLFFGDEVYKHVRDLSGGEKGRLALAKLIYSGASVLVLDEPTNHLDIPSREALEAALEAYEGTIVTISHDRFFLDRVATQILALDGEGNAEHYNGDYTEYHNWKAARENGLELAELAADHSVSEAQPSGRVRSRKRPVSVDGVALGMKSVPPATAVGSKPQRGKPHEAARVKVIKKPRDSEMVEA